MNRKFFHCESCEESFYVEADDDSFDFESYYCPFCGNEVEIEEELDLDE